MARFAISLKAISVAGFFVIIAGCTSQFAAPDSTSSTSESFAQTFEKQLVDAGMSADNAAFVASESGSTASLSLQGVLQKGGILLFSAEDLQTVSAEALKTALVAVASNSHFANVEAKQNALEQISKAHFGTIEQRLQSEDSLQDIIETCAEEMGDAISQVGLADADLKEGLKKIGIGMMSALDQSSLAVSDFSGITNSFTKGTISGLLNNPYIASSAADFMAAINEGALQEIGNFTNASLAEDNKGQIIRELIQGVKDGLADRTDMSESDRSGLISSVCDDAQVAVNTVAPTLNTHVYDAISIVTNEPPMPLNGFPVGAVGSVSCTGYLYFEADTSEGSVGSTQMQSIAQCASYCNSIANNNDSAAVTCVAGGQTYKSYSYPRTTVYADPNAPTVCVARITTSSGQLDYAPAVVVNETACRTFCDSVQDPTGTKKCLLGAGSSQTVLHDYSANSYTPPTPSSTVSAPQCNQTYDLSVPAGVSPGACGGPGLVQESGTSSISGAKLHSIDIYETASDLHGLLILSQDPLLVQSYRTVGETEIAISSGSEPVYLALKAYEPTKFKITGEVSRVQGVFVTGYHCHSVEGVDSSKVMINTYGQSSTNALSALKVAMMSYSSTYGTPKLFAQKSLELIPSLAGVALGSAQGSYSSACHDKIFTIP